MFGVYGYPWAESIIDKKGARISPGVRPRIHFTPPYGRLNDPNGVCWYEGKYHMFFQYNPIAPIMGRASWGHTVSDDLMTWQRQPIAMKPNRLYDWCGVWSGSSVNKDGVLHLFYTAFGPKQQQVHAVLEGEKYKKKGLIIRPGDLPIDGSKKNFRDPKVIPYKNGYLMAVGGMVKEHGAIFFFGSDTLEKWSYLGLEEYPQLAGALECPDIFELGGKFVITAGSTENEPGRCEWYVYSAFPLDGGKLLQSGILDYGSAYYAPQSFEHNGRRIQHAWARTEWPGEPKPATRKHGFVGIMNIPRELTLCNNRLCIFPVEELESRLCKDAPIDLLSGTDERCFAARLSVSTKKCDDIKIELLKQAENKGAELTLDLKKGYMEFRQDDKDAKKIELDLLLTKDEIDIQIIVDLYIAEVFVGGEFAFSFINYSEEAAKSSVKCAHAAVTNYEGYLIKNKEGEN